MIRTLLRIAMTFSLLTAGYFGYVEGFALVADRLDREPDVPVLPYDPSPSRTARETRQLALTAFGPGHWAIHAKIRYYDSQRGYWIFAEDYERKNNGKRFEFHPFALIWKHRNGTALKTVTSARAVVDFNRSLDLVSGKRDEPTRVLRARIEGGVRIRDDKGTPADPGDDLTITMADLDYSEERELIQTDGHVEIRDRDTLGTGEGMVVELRPITTTLQTPGPTGYNGARRIRILRDVRITVQDVGRSGIVPGGATQRVQVDRAREPRPGEITSDGEMRVDLPEPRRQPRVGPPAPQGPTYAHFARNVRVRQGDAQEPEQLDCDQLHLTLVPDTNQKARKHTHAAAAALEVETTEASLDPANQDSRSAAQGAFAMASPVSDGGPVSDLTLQRANAKGHAVWLQSKAHGLVARGNELTYIHNGGNEPDTTYFRGDRDTEIRKQDSAQGTIDVIRTLDVTLYHSGATNEPAAAVARGPGWLETRRLADQAVVRTARWNDQVVLRPVENDPKRRQLTLEGNPEVRDLERGRLTARSRIIASLVARTSSETNDTPPPQTSPDASKTAEPGGGYRIEMVQAWDDVLLEARASQPGPERQGQAANTAPLLSRSSGQVIRAREWLGVVFEDGPGAISAASRSSRAAGDPDTTNRAGAEPSAPLATAGARDTRSTSPDAAPTPLQVEATRIWAWVMPTRSAETTDRTASADGANGPLDGSWQARQVRLRGNVSVHQDPPPGKRRGLDLTGDEVDLIYQAEQRYEVRAYGGLRPARAQTDEFLIEGPVIGLDQAKHYACVIGAGKLVQENAGNGMFGRAAPDALPARFDGIDDGNGARPPDRLPGDGRGPLYIAWGCEPTGGPRLDPDGKPVESWMKFYGQPLDERGLPTLARAHFQGGVRAWTREAVLTCKEMWAYLDQQVDFSKPPRRGPTTPERGDRGARGSDVEPAPAARVDRVLCERDVDMVYRKVDEAGELVEKRRVRGDRVLYERATNRFHVDSPGEVDLYDRGKPMSADAGTPASGGPRPRRQASPMATPGQGSVRPASFAQASLPGTRPSANAGRGQAQPLRLVSIKFDDQMIGQLQSTPTAGKRAAGQAEFFGNVRVMNADVANEDVELDPDAPPRDYIYSVSDTLRVITEPPAGAAEGAPDRVLVQAWGELFALVVRPGRETAIQANDHMDYNSETGVSYIYGGDTGVSIVDQSGTGQPASYGRGSTVEFNHKTGTHRLLDARTIQLVDPRSGVRAGIPPTPPKPKPSRPKLSRFPRSDPRDKNRLNFEGR